MKHALLQRPTKTTRTQDVVREAINAGRPLPLTVMLENMWRFNDEAKRLSELPPGHPEHDPTIEKACRSAAQRCANDAAPFIHPRLATVALREEDEEEAEQRRVNARVTSDALKGKSVQELGNLYLQIARGDELEIDAPTISSSDASNPSDDDDQP